MSGGDGIRRKVDDLGRVVIPASIRSALGIEAGDLLEITVEADRVVLHRPVEACTFCGGARELTEFRGRIVCWSCTAALRALDREREAEPPNPFGF
jgi:transcriptional pleiotropic regulator of transition state genes